MTILLTINVRLFIARFCNHNIHFFTFPIFRASVPAVIPIASLICPLFCSRIRCSIRISDFSLFLKLVSISCLIASSVKSVAYPQSTTYTVDTFIAVLSFQKLCHGIRKEMCSMYPNLNSTPRSIFSTSGLMKMLFNSTIPRSKLLRILLGFNSYVYLLIYLVTILVRSSLNISDQNLST